MIRRKLFTILFLISLGPRVIMANNIIELRNDGPGGEYFNATIRYAPETPSLDYYLESRNPDVWSGSKTTINGRTIPESVLWTLRVDYSQGDGYTPETSNSLLKDRNIPKDKNYNDVFYNPCTRDTKGCDVSKKYGNHQKDWDYIVKKKDQILADAGLSSTSPDWDKAKAIVKHVAFLISKPEGRGHPVEVLEYGNQHCGYQSATMIALASTMGIPGREISWWTHTVCELYIDGKWRYAENSPYVLPNIPPEFEQGPLFTYNFLEMISNPKDHGINRESYSTELYCGRVRDSGPKYILYNVEAYTNWIFNMGSWPEVILMPNSALEIGALYPGEPSVFKCKNIPRMWLNPYRSSTSTKKIEQAKGIRQKFYISSLEKVTKVYSHLLFKSQSNNIPANGGDWYYLVNGDKYYLRDYGGWNLHGNYEGTGYSYLSFDVPLKSLIVPVSSTIINQKLWGNSAGNINNSK